MWTTTNSTRSLWGGLGLSQPEIKELDSHSPTPSSHWLPSTWALLTLGGSRRQRTSQPNGSTGDGDECSIVLTTECLCLPKFICWNLIPSVHLGGGSVIRMGPLWWNKYTNRSCQRASSPLPSHEDTGRRSCVWTRKQLSQTVNLLPPWSWSSRVQNCEKTFSIIYKHSVCC